MDHLLQTNRWLKSFKKQELYDNCNDCVSKCKADMEDSANKCSIYMSDVWKLNFGENEPADVLCTAGYLKDQLFDKRYPLNVKRALYKKPKLRADDDVHQVDWNVPG